MITNCSKTNISLEDLINLQQFGQILSLIGSCSLVPLLVTKLIVPKFRLFPSRMSTLFVLASLGLNITILTGRSQNWEQLWLGKLNHEAPTQFCIIQGFFFQFFAAAIIMLWLCIALCMYFVLVGKKSFEEVQTHETMMHVFWLGGSLLMTGIPSLLHNAVPQLGTSYCWLTDDNYFAYQIAFFHSEMFGSLFVGSILLYKVVRKLAKVSDLGDDDFVSLVRSYVLRNILNVLAFAFVFVVIVVFVINQILDRHDIWCVTLPMAYAHSMAVSGSGIVTVGVLSRVEYYKTAIKVLNCCGYNGEKKEMTHLLDRPVSDDDD